VRSSTPAYAFADAAIGSSRPPRGPAGQAFAEELRTIYNFLFHSVCPVTQATALIVSDVEDATDRRQDGAVPVVYLVTRVTDHAHYGTDCLVAEEQGEQVVPAARQAAHKCRQGARRRRRPVSPCKVQQHSRVAAERPTRGARLRLCRSAEGNCGPARVSRIVPNDRDVRQAEVPKRLKHCIPF
jgi:hypothetical protein